MKWLLKRLVLTLIGHQILKNYFSHIDKKLKEKKLMNQFSDMRTLETQNIFIKFDYDNNSTRNRDSKSHRQRSRRRFARRMEFLKELQSS